MLIKLLTKKINLPSVFGISEYNALIIILMWNKVEAITHMNYTYSTPYKVNRIISKIIESLELMAKMWKRLVMFTRGNVYSPLSKSYGSNCS